MNNLEEILISTENNNPQSSCNAWDPRTGSNLMTYKGGGSTNLHGLSMIRNEFILSANSTKPLIHLWPINSQEQVNGVRYVVPGIVSSLAVSPDGNYLVAGIQESIYLWQLCSGAMLNLLAKHYQTVTTIKFTDDGSHFVSAGQDGSVLVWNLTMISKSDNREPLYSINDHALSVKDIHIGNGGIRTMLCTVSTDRTCRIYDLLSSKLLLNLVFGVALTSITMDILETNVFVGSTKGEIFMFNISSAPRTKEYHVTNEDYTNKFAGHNGMAVTALSLSLDGKTICSGGEDEKVYLWDIASKQLIRTIPHKGVITNVFFKLISKNLFNPEIKFNICTENLKRMIDTEKARNDHVVEMLITENDHCDEDLTSVKSNKSNVNHSEITQEMTKLRNQVAQLQRINKELYIFTIDKVLKTKPDSY